MQYRTIIATLALASLTLGLPAYAVDAALAEEALEARKVFSVKVTRLGFSRLCRVDVRASLEGLDGAIEVSLDEPLEFRLGVKGLDVKVRVLDESESEVAVVTTRLEEGTQSFTLPLRVPREGTYRILLEDAGLDATPARARILPDGLVSLVLRTPPDSPPQPPSVAVLHSR